MEVNEANSYILNQILSNFDFAYMITINILTYIIIKILDSVDNRDKVPTTEKRIALITSIIIVSVLYYFIGYDNYIIMINSAICSPVFYSWILKPILTKKGLGYKNETKI